MLALIRALIAPTGGLSTWIRRRVPLLFSSCANQADPTRRGFVLTTLLGIAGSFVATYLGQAIGRYRADEGAGLIGAVVGAVIVLVVWGLFAPRDRALTRCEVCEPFR